MRFSIPLVALFVVAALATAPTHARLLIDLTPGPGSTFDLYYGSEMEAEYLGGDYFLVRDCTLWKLDGETGAPTVLYQSVEPFCQGDSMGRVGNRFVFSMNRKVWASDGTAVGTVQLPIPVGQVTPKWWPWLRWPGWILIAVDQAVAGADAVWLTDGTAANTRVLQTTGNGSSVGFLADGRAALLGSGVWSAESPVAPVVPVLTGAFQNGSAQFSPAGRATKEERGRVFFMATTPAAGTEPWSTDLSAAGTTMLVDHTPGTGSSTLSQGIAPYVDSRFYFVVGGLLYHSALGSGTSARLNPVNTAVDSSPRNLITPVGGDVSLFSMVDGNDYRLWSLRDAPVPTVAATSGGPGALPRTAYDWIAGWPERTFVGTPFAVANPFPVYEVSTPPTGVAYRGVNVPMTGDERMEFRGDVLWGLGTFRSWGWRRPAAAPETLSLVAPTHLSGTYRFSPRGGPLQLFVTQTAALGHEPYALDLPATGMPMCNLPAAKLADATTVTDSIDITPASVVATHRVLDARVHVRMRHSYVGDLTISLEHVPSGRSAVLMQRPRDNAGSCASNDLAVVFDDAAMTTAATCADDDEAAAYPRMQSLLPAQPLATFFRGEYAGEWRISVTDGASGDIGGLAEWCLELGVGEVPARIFQGRFE